MKRFFGNLFRIILRWIDVDLETKLLPPHRPDQQRLDGLMATVFIREPNGSRTNIEHYIEQELINRGARVVVANQKAGLELLKNGFYKPLAEGVHFSFVGSLKVMKGFIDVIEDEEEVEVPGVIYQLIFRLINSDGTILASGTSEGEEEANLSLHTDVLCQLAADAVAHLDETNVWSHIIVS